MRLCARNHLSQWRYLSTEAGSFYDSLHERLNTALCTISEQNIRNFSIISHIDHGKSSLANRLLQQCGNISTQQQEEALQLDTLKVEKERGITVKAQNATMLYFHPGHQQYFMLNLIDTPGHVDFSFEVNRSLSACEGALLLVDASQGIQAQTIATFRAAKQLNLRMIPVLTKIDMANAQVDDMALDLAILLDTDPELVLQTSSKTGVGIDAVFDSIIERISPPKLGSKIKESGFMRCLVLDSIFDIYRGIVCTIKIVDGELKVGDKISSIATGKQYEVQEVGIMLPNRYATTALRSGQIGYVIAGIKSLSEAIVGDTIFSSSTEEVIPLQKN